MAPDPHRATRGRISLSDAMVRAVLDGQKTVTRRLVPAGGSLARYGRPSDVLWVGESWAFDTRFAGWREAPDGAFVHCATAPTPSGWRRRQPRFMPRRIARLFVEVERVSVEPLHAITEADAVAEGAAHLWAALGYDEARDLGNEWTRVAVAKGWGKQPPDFRAAYGALWVRMHGEPSWRSNPDVVRVQFRRVDAGEGKT